jgi:thiosulfate/3-mercaptopyruvate sulfurtransferase
MATFVNADWVSQRLDSAGFLVIDTRFSMRHLMGHLKAAVNVPPPKLRDAQGILLPPEDLAGLFGAAGLGDDVTPVLYDGYDGRNVAFAAWALEHLGRDDVHIMGTVFDDWKEQGREIFYRPVRSEPQPFSVKINSAVRAGLAEIRDAKDLVLVDARSREEYDGEAGVDEKPGHIPGAVNIVWQEIVGKDGRLQANEEEVRKALEAANIKPNDRIVTYCKAGARASVAYVAMKRLGYDVRLYLESYAEWEQSGLPVEI